MPLVYERTFRVRQYECDAYGHVNHANYLRYMQEAAFDASAAAGYGFDWYAAAGQHWLVRESDITYHRPLTYGDAVTIKTYVADFRRVRSRRAYELRHAISGDLVAEAHTDWIFLDGATQRPISIPLEMQLAFYPEGPPPEAPPRERFPDAPPPPPRAFTQQRLVEWRDIDTVGHVNNANYLAYCEDCAVQAAAYFGWTMERMMAAGFAIVARRYRIEYKQPALLNDELAVTTWVADVKRATAVRHYTITRASDQTLIARAYALWVWVNLTTGKPIRIPAEFLADFAGHTADNAGSQDGNG
jgi:acyl-CoA thioester hydrolase